MGTDRTLLFFHPMFGDPEPLDGQIHDLTPLWHCGWVLTQVVLAVLAPFNGMDEDLIRHLHLLEVMPTVTRLPARLLAALVPQALGGAHKPIGGGRQTAIMAIFGLLPLQRFHALLERPEWR